MCVFVFLTLGETFPNPVRTSHSNLSYVCVCVWQCLTVVRYLEGVVALRFLSPAAHSGETPVLVTPRVSVGTKKKTQNTSSLVKKKN